MTELEMIQEIQRISGSNPRKCMKCGKCTASCPAFDQMEYHPHQFVDMIQTGRLNELLHSKGIDHCLSCFACVERCPRSVEPAALIEAVRVMLMRPQGGNLLTADQIPARLDEELPQQAITAALRKFRR